VIEDRGARFDLRTVLEERIVHDVAGEAGAIRKALVLQVVDGGLRGAEEEVGGVVGEDAIDLFGHQTIEAAEAGLDVGEWHAELRCGERAGQRRVRVAEDDDPVWLLGNEDGLEAQEHLGGLLSMGS